MNYNGNDTTMTMKNKSKHKNLKNIRKMTQVARNMGSVLKVGNYLYYVYRIRNYGIHSGALSSQNLLP